MEKKNAIFLSILFPFYLLNPYLLKVLLSIPFNKLPCVRGGGPCWLAWLVGCSFSTLFFEPWSRKFLIDSTRPTMDFLPANMLSVSAELWFEFEVPSATSCWLLDEGLLLFKGESVLGVLGPPFVRVRERERPLLPRSSPLLFDEFSWPAKLIMQNNAIVCSGELEHHFLPLKNKEMIIGLIS